MHQCIKFILFWNDTLQNKITNIRQHNKYLLEYIGCMFRPVKRSSSGQKESESKVLFRYRDPNIYNCKKYKIWYWI